MKLPHKQRGMSIWMLIYVLFTLSIFGYVGLKLKPLYLEGAKVERAINRVVEDPSLVNKPKAAVVTAIVKRLDVDGEYRITERNYAQYLTISNKGKRIRIQAKYEVGVPLFYNLEVTAKFEYAAQGG
jgi:hypothetical protein